MIGSLGLGCACSEMRNEMHVMFFLVLFFVEVEAKKILSSESLRCSNLIGSLGFAHAQN